jgi:hypothetical protein
MDKLIPLKAKTPYTKPLYAHGPLRKDEQAFLGTLLGKDAPEGFSLHMRPGYATLRGHFYNGHRTEVHYPSSLEMLDRLCAIGYLTAEGQRWVSGDQTSSLSVDYKLSRSYLQKLAGSIPSPK